MKSVNAVPLRIAFDLDGTLADLDSALDAVADELFPRESREATAPNVTAAPDGAAGPQAAASASSASAGKEADSEALSPEEEQLEPPRLRALTRRQQHDLWAAVRATENFWETLAETEPGIVSRLAAIAGERRWEVLFITQRPGCEGDTAQRQTHRWLAQHGFELPSVYVLPAGASRGKVATALSLDVVVDDRTENCLDVKVDSAARAFLVCRTPNPTMTVNASRLGIEVVGSVSECLDILTAGRPTGSGLMGRLRRMVTAITE